MTPGLSYLPADVTPLSTVALAALSGRPAPPSLPGTIVPGSLAEVPEPRERHDADEREELARTLEQRLSAFEPHVAVLESARSLARPGAACVVTGQQPGFLGGPLYNLYKALSAVRLARDLANAWQRPVVPVFWNHADDHDVAEVHSIHVVNQNLDLRKVSLAGMSSGKRSFHEIVLEGEAHRLASIGELLRQILPATLHRDPAIERFLPRAGETLAGAFTRAWIDLLGPLGLVVLEPQWLRYASSRALARLVGLDPRAALREGAERLAAEHEVPIDPATAALVFHHVNGRRLALRAGGEGFRYDDEPGSRTPSELAAELVDRPAEWSPGALLRPLVQDELLPVAAYVGGFGELAYHAELPPLRERAGLPPTPFVPRLSATLVDRETRASLARLEVELQDVVAGRAPRESEEGGPPVPVADDLRAVAAHAASALKELKEPLAALDRGLAMQLKKTAGQVEALVDKLAGKAERVVRNQEGKGRRHARRVESFLRPRGEPQERVLGVLEMVARHGEEWIVELVGEIDPFPSEHLVVDLDGDLA